MFDYAKQITGLQRCNALYEYSFLHSYIQLFIHSFILKSVLNRSLAPQKPVLHKERTNTSYFNSQYLLFLVRSSSSCLRFLPCLSFTFILPSIFPSIMRFRRQFPCKILPIQLVFLFHFCTILMSHSSLYNTSEFLT